RSSGGRAPGRSGPDRRSGGSRRRRARGPMDCSPVLCGGRGPGRSGPRDASTSSTEEDLLMRQWTVDAFAAQPFKGNPACGVGPFTAWPDAGWMQSLAAENNQAETAFLLRTGDPARFGLRWFTPALEVPLGGHATLASGPALLSANG